MASQPKRDMASRRGEGSSEPQSVGGQSAKEAWVKDAVAYDKAVKDGFKDDRAKYVRFVELFRDYKAQRIDTAGAKARAKELFQGHGDLLLGFNILLPEGCEIVLPGIFLERNKHKTAVALGSQVLEDLIVVNNLKCRFSCNSPKVAYELGTEDFFFRRKKRPKSVDGNSMGKSRILQKFHRLLPDS